MKRYSYNKIKALLVGVLLVCNIAAWAMPAKPGVIQTTQADGSIINIRIHGDEFFGWRTTEDGYPISAREGNYYYVRYGENGGVEFSDRRVMQGGRKTTPPDGFAQSAQSVKSIASRVSTARRAQQNSSSAAMSSALGTRCDIPLEGSTFPKEGEVRSLVILVEFQDVKFTVSNPKTAFTNKLNLEGYNVAGATGSARDYFLANSGGLLQPTFDVVGPYTLPNNMAYYGANDEDGFDIRPRQMVTDGAAAAYADGVDFSQYDYSRNGLVDNIFIYYAGHNEAEGGSEDSVWPHKWAVYDIVNYDGKFLNVYACTSELRGAGGSTIAGIGTFCHEFSHVFGLYDHYDTDGDINGYSYGLGDYDIMSSGGYNNNGNTPPLYNALELMMLEWGEPSYYQASQYITQPPITEKVFYRINTDVDDEFFLIENRQKNSSVWDSYLDCEGLFITHVDMSAPMLSSWKANNPNGNTSHECFKFVPSNGRDLNASTVVWEDIAYPNKKSGNSSWSYISTPKAASWSGAELSHSLTQISQDGENMIYAAISKENSTIYIGQTTLYFGWSSLDYSAFTIELESADGEVTTYTPTQEYIEIEGLSAGETYSLRLYGKSEDVESELILGQLFTTYARVTDTPIIALPNYRYSAGDVIYLCAINLLDGDVPTWYVGDEPQTSNIITLSKGEYDIKCEVERAGVVYTTRRKIEVY